MNNKIKTKIGSHIKKLGRFRFSFNPIPLNLFRAIDSSTAGLQKLTKVVIYNSKTIILKL